MDKQENKDFEETNINSLWLKNIYNNLMDLKMKVLLARHGCQDVLEYIQIPANQMENVLPQIQFKNLQLIVSSMESLLIDTQTIIDDETYKKSMKTLQLIKESFGTPNLYLKLQFNQYAKTEWYLIQPLFEKTLDQLDLMRANLIKLLEPTLYIRSEEKASGMDKIKEAMEK